MTVILLMYQHSNTTVIVPLLNVLMDLFTNLCGYLTVNLVFIFVCCEGYLRVFSHQAILASGLSGYRFYFPPSISIACSSSFITYSGVLIWDKLMFLCTVDGWLLSSFRGGPVWLTVLGEIARSSLTSLCSRGWLKINSSSCWNRQERIVCCSLLEWLTHIYTYSIMWLEFVINKCQYYKTNTYGKCISGSLLFNKLDPLFRLSN